MDIKTEYIEIEEWKPSKQTSSNIDPLGKSYESFVRKRVLVKYQSQCEVVEM